MYSPDGKSEIEVLPSKVEEMKAKGWTDKVKKSTKKEVSE
jgi:hypothetical protein